MESLSLVLSSCPPVLQSHLKTQKPSISSLPNSIPTLSHQNQTQFPSASQFLFQGHPLLLQTSPLFQNITKTQLSFTLFNLLTSLPCFASEAVVSSADKVSDKINLESVLVAIDDFFNRNPFFVAGCTFIWLVVIPLTEEYLRKFKFISAIDAFKKLRDDPSAQLLDIRGRKSLKYLKSPNLKILNKDVVKVPFSEGDEDGFMKLVLESFGDVANTVVCVLDNFDGNSMKVAELLFKNGFKEAYAIRGGVRGEKGWLAIQDYLLPPSVHMYPKKKVKTSQQPGINGGVLQKTDDRNDATSPDNTAIEEKWKTDGHLNKSTESIPDIKSGS
ncbi:rhodanese-like domain-containing protein 4A, chloroplastic [Juglans regia]|uniref:Rhodanese-like domain-containing protein 4A, chloroplastic n=2 Tax=Juglans regia TaxID=51240 RepID=A0A2I4G0N6_JUGRE|nr:rhodanese-like domain-containing protein 4A, chloroplastic [Juglans regia]XP_018837454.1 rhodanese-like domain-containing protein 4A, chloroplastic [Juglans regia]